ncbi:rhodanese-related sulfurtransferase [Bacteroidia bacterium]|nr:rhodanese-related sulfurtransferase [Bacteroidia bacterium]
MKLHNTINGEELKEKIKSSDESRTTISFYKYVNIGNPQLFRDHIFYHWNPLGVLGRIYVANEGLNAQLSVPTEQLDAYKSALEDIVFLQNIRLNYAVEDDGKSFFRLTIKVRKKIVADGLDDDLFDMSKPGQYLKVEEFNKLTDREDTVLIDMRNHYESEVGHFDGAWCPDVDTFRDQLPLVVDDLKDQKNKPVVMYCTGGIRCEKASAYLKHKGFKDVYHLEGGIIKYARDAKKDGLRNKFIGKNFVFDERLNERITEDVIADCHQCGEPFDDHTNCINKACNLLFIQCPKCAEKLEGTCSEACKEVAALPEEVQRELRKGKDNGVRIFSKGRF